MSGPFVVGIMGAGRMAQGFDSPGDTRVLSLANAVVSAPAFRLGGFYDLDAAKAEAAETKWRCAPSPRDRTAWLGSKWDVIFIATPDERHADDVGAALAQSPKAIMVEKPFAVRTRDTTELLDEMNRKAVPVLVDFPRRYHSAVSDVRDMIADGVFGQLMSVTCVFSGKAEKAAVHMLDLIHDWWGGDWDITLAHREKNTATISFGHGTHDFAATFVELPGKNYYTWEIRMYCERGKIELAGSPEMLDVSLVRPHPLYPSFDVLTRTVRHDMEAEPLLPRLMIALEKILTDPVVAAAQIRRETATQNFIGRALGLLQGAQPALATAH